MSHVRVQFQTASAVLADRAAAAIAPTICSIDSNDEQPAIHRWIHTAQLWLQLYGICRTASSAPGQRHPTACSMPSTGRRDGGRSGARVCQRRDRHPGLRSHCHRASAVTSAAPEHRLRRSGSRHRIQHQTGWSIKKFARTARHYRTAQIRTGRQTLTAAEPLPDDLRDALAKITLPGSSR